MSAPLLVQKDGEYLSPRYRDRQSLAAGAAEIKSRSSPSPRLGALVPQERSREDIAPGTFSPLKTSNLLLAEGRKPDKLSPAVSPACRAATVGVRMCPPRLSITQQGLRYAAVGTDRVRGTYFSRRQLLLCRLGSCR